MNKEYRMENETRLEDYWQELNRLSDRYRCDPAVQKQQRKESIQYWLILFTTNLVVAPLFMLFLFWYVNEFNIAFDVFLNDPAIKVLWIVIAMTGMALAVVFVPKKPKLWDRLAMSKIKNIDPPHNHKPF